MKIAIIGAGFTGLTAGYELVKKGHSVTIFEKASLPGGLALGYKKDSWKWSLEEYYHHWFTNDTAILNLAKEINYTVLTFRPKTSSYIHNKIYQLDSPLTFLQFPELSPIQRLRMLATLAFLRFTPFWHPLEKTTAAAFLPRYMGEKAYDLLWKPLLVNKFGAYTNTISLAWFWGRITKRTPSLAYPEGGFLHFAQSLVAAIEKKGGKLVFSAEIATIESGETGVSLGKKYGRFDKVIVTLPSFGFLKLCPQLPTDYKKQLAALQGLGAITMVLRLKKQFFADGTYWLNVCETKSPVLAVVEHTNFIDKKYYNNEHLVYLGNYLPIDHPYFKKNNTELLALFDPFLRKLNPQYASSLLGYDVFKVPFAQPIIPINYSSQIPAFRTPLRNVYLANMQQVYPWDRGTNYAVELGNKISALIENEQ